MNVYIFNIVLFGLIFPLCFQSLECLKLGLCDFETKNLSNPTVAHQALRTEMILVLGPFGFGIIRFFCFDHWLLFFQNCILLLFIQVVKINFVEDSFIKCILIVLKVNFCCLFIFIAIIQPALSQIIRCGMVLVLLCARLFNQVAKIIGFVIWIALKMKTDQWLIKNVECLCYHFTIFCLYRVEW